MILLIEDNFLEETDLFLIQHFAKQVIEDPFRTLNLVSTQQSPFETFPFSAH
jgi:hypothetical protein